MVYRIVDVTPVGSHRLVLREVLTTDDRIVLETATLKAAGRLVEEGLLPSSDRQRTAVNTSQGV